MDMANIFELDANVSETDFLTASDKMQKEFYDQYDILKSRELFKEKNTWIEILRWEGNGPSKEMQNAYQASKTCMAYMGLIKMDSIKGHLKQVRVHNKTK